MMQAKYKGLSQERLTSAEHAQDARLAMEREKGSTAERYAFSMKKAETVIRHHLNLRGLRSEQDVRARSATKDDAYLWIAGKRYVAEVKCGGTVGKPEIDGSWTEEDILPRADYVIVPVIDRIEDEDDLLDMSVILTRAEWLELCATCSRKGLAGTFHTTSGGAVIAFQPTPLNKLRRALEEMLDNGEGWTVRTYEMER